MLYVLLTCARVVETFFFCRRSLPPLEGVRIAPPLEGVQCLVNFKCPAVATCPVHRATNLFRSLVPQMFLH